MEIKFLSELHTTPVPRDTYAPWLGRNTDKVKLVKDFNVQVDDEIIVVPKGYITDGATIPRLLWVIKHPFSTEARKASCVHDYIYSHLHDKYTRKFADELMRAIMLHEGASRFIANSFYRSVRMFGRGGW